MIPALVNSGLNVRRGSNRPGSRSAGYNPAAGAIPRPGTQPAATPPANATGAAAPTNVAPPGSPLPVGNGIQPFTQPMVNLQVPHPTPIAPVAPATPVAPAPAAGAPSDVAKQYVPTGLNFGPGNDLQSTVIAPSATAPDREAMAKATLANFDKATADQQREDYRQVGQQAASLGRLGMGQTAQDIQEVGRKHLTDRATLETQLAADTADKSIQDAINSRNELRGERSYETGQSQTAIDRAVQAAQLEEALKSGQFQRGITLGQYAKTGNPAYAQLQAAQANDTSGADLSSIAELLRRYGYSSAGATP